MAAHVAILGGIGQIGAAIGAASSQQAAALFAEYGLLAIIGLAIWAVQGSFASTLTISSRGILRKELAGLLVAAYKTLTRPRWAIIDDNGATGNKYITCLMGGIGGTMGNRGGCC